MSDGARSGVQGGVMRELVAVHRLADTRLGRALRPLGLSMTQVSILALLSARPDGATVGDLAVVMEINQPGVSKIVAALAGRGAVEVAPAADDARRRVVRLTPGGHDLLVRARRAMHPETTWLFGDLDDDQLGQLHELLLVLRRRLEGPTAAAD